MDPVETGGIQTESPAQFATRLNLPFSNHSLVSRALTHRSYLNEYPEAIEDNERLEFLGDAVLDFLVGSWLYNRFPEMREGQLTRMRSALVRTEQLAVFARGIDLGKAMRLGRGESQAGGRERQALLCACFEALIGAIYLDAGLDVVKEFIKPMLEKAVLRILKEHSDQDPKSHLQEVVQKDGNEPPYYRTVSATGPEHKKTFEVEVLVNGSVLGRGVGHSKRSAAKAAARNALISLGVD